MKRIAKFAAVSVGLTMAFGAVATPAAAQSDLIAQLQAQINALMAQLSSLQGGSTTPSTGAACTFTRPLTVGSQGNDVACLQQYLVARGHLVMPAGASYGYFGTITRDAVARWQAANGVAPAAGYFGPISQARYVAVAGAPTTPGGPTTPGTGITTPGVEGTLTATRNPTPTNGVRVYGGENRAAALGLRLEARLSDIRVERVTVQVPGTSFYNRVASRIYILDGSTVVGSSDLNSNTVVRNGSDYEVTITGINYIVPRNSTRVLTVAFDIYSNVAGQQGSKTVTVPQDGVRGVDGAGLNVYAGSSAITGSFDLRDELATEASLRISLNTNSPVTGSVVASEGTQDDEIDNVEVLRFDVRAERDSVEIRDLTAGIAVGGSGNASVTAVYLYDGSTLIGSDVVVNGSTTFRNIDYVIARDQTRTLSLRVDIRNASNTPTTVTATTTANTTNIVAENSVGDILGVLAGTSLNGNVAGNTITFIKAGPEITLANPPSIQKSSTQAGTSTAQATFHIRIRALGEDVTLANTGAFEFKRYFGSSSSSATTTGVSYSAPSSGVILGTGKFTIPEGNTVTIPVDVIYTAAPGDTPTATAFGLANVNWGLTASAAGNESDTNFMVDRLEWRTPNIVLP